MAVDVTTFKARFPEFMDAPNDLAQAKLNDAITLCPSEVWGDSTVDNSIAQQGIFAYTAQALAVSPFARKLALTKKDGSTIYDGRLTMLKRMVTSGFRNT